MKFTAFMSNQQERIRSINNYSILARIHKRTYSFLSENHKYWLGGFVEGEGSLLVSIVANPKLKHGVALQPEFNVTQHISGLNILNSYKLLFNDLGNLKKKSGSNDVWVYSIKGTKNLKELVLPYFEKYIVPFSCKHKADIFEKFSKIINVLYSNLGETLDKDLMLELVKLIYEMNPDSKGKSRKRDIQEIIDIIEANN